ncbi:E3 ubiquitin-protein ligase RSL1 [Diospyros lotus]|uniref:E3 ubiquitin-protein ligase RSL1 n=1 Tax=Diospyros lotus TaxID=55363 RepID=UPI002258363C|nr:E3 ubiquitin-protein ligase RSL1 [Diospyros lotus]
MSHPNDNRTVTTSTDPDDGFETIAAQRRELMAAQALESDLDLAFRLQMQEAIDASLSLCPPSSSPPRPAQPQEDEDVVFNLSILQAEELDRFERERRDRLVAEAEMKRIKEDLHRRIHDYKVADEIHYMAEDDWDEYGDNFARPYGEGTSSSSSSSSNGVNTSVETFRVYFNGLLLDERALGTKVPLAGIGVAICDSRDNLIFELKKPLTGNGTNRQAAQAKALIEGLNAAIDLDLKRVVFYCDCFPLFQFVTGRWSPKQRKIKTLVNQVTLLRKNFLYSAPVLVARNDIKFAFTLAREAIVSQINRPSDYGAANNKFETCVICLEDREIGQIFSVDGCLHRYCFSCMKQHVEVKLLHGIVPKCPHDSCDSLLKIESCGQFLTPRLIEIMSQRIKEASIPAAEKVYCPYPKCSVLMSKSETLEFSKNTLDQFEESGVRKCVKCQRLFCINCKVPWHENMSCILYKIRNPYPPVEDVKLKSLADRNLWRQCIKCKHMIELAAGCYHMTCRCGYEFCYTCGAEWMNKKATCSCPLWDEGNILYDEEEEEDEGNMSDDGGDYYPDFYDSSEDDFY